MELSDEEIKAIEKVKEAIRVDREQRIVTIYDEKPLFRDQLQIIIDLINNQQKEIEEKSTIMAGAEKVKQLEKEIEYLKEGYHKGVTDGRISMKYEVQDKIREKIKEYQEKAEDVKQKYKGVYAYKSDYLEALAKIEGYQELLEESQEDGDHIPRID